MSPLNKYIPIISDKEENTNQKKNTKILAVVKKCQKKFLKKMSEKIF